MSQSPSSGQLVENENTKFRRLGNIYSLNPLRRVSWLRIKKAARVAAKIIFWSQSPSSGQLVENKRSENEILLWSRNWMSQSPSSGQLVENTSVEAVDTETDVRVSIPFVGSVGWELVKFLLIIHLMLFYRLNPLRRVSWLRIIKNCVAKWPHENKSQSPSSGQLVENSLSYFSFKFYWDFWDFYLLDFRDFSKKVGESKRFFDF